MIFVFVWLISLTMIISKSFHVAAQSIVSFCIMAGWSSVTCMYRMFFTPSSVSAHFGFFHVLAVANSAAVNVEVQLLSQISIFCGYTPRVELTDHACGSYLFSYLRNLYTALPEKAMAPHSSTLAWKIPWMEEPGRLQSMGSLRVRHDWETSLSLFTFLHWRRKWQPTPVFLPGESQGRGSLVGRRLWGCTESDTTEVT